VAIPLIGWALILAVGGGALFLLGRPTDPPPPGTVVMVGAIGDLELEVRQQTSTSLEWSVRNANGSVGSGAGTLAQNPIADMMTVAFDNADANDAVTLSFLASGASDPRVKTHGDYTLAAEPRNSSRGTTWSWSMHDDAHDVVALGEMPSRGAALLKAEEAASAHLGMASDGVPMPEPPPDAVHGVAFHDCTVRVANLPAWLDWARARIVAAFDATDGMPTPDDLLDATIGQAMEDAGHPGCDLDDLRLGTTSWDVVEPKIAHVLEAIADPTFLSIPGPDELMAAALVGSTPDNRGHKERAGTWGIVARPTGTTGTPTAFSWWAWPGARLLDSDAQFRGSAQTIAEAVALAKTAIAALPADAHAEAKG